MISNLNAQEINWIYFNYYSGNGLLGSANRDNYMKYADVVYYGKKYRAITFSEYRPAYTYQTKNTDSSLQDNNGYSTDTIYWFEYRPLNWKVVSPDEQTVVCKDIIDSQAYANTVFTLNGVQYYNDNSCSTSATNWKSSSLREWLNNDFLHCAFSQDEIMLLSGNDSGDSTDKVWLPSSSVANSLKTSNNHYINYKTEYPQFYRTDYAKCQGAASDDYILSTKSNSTEGMGISTETQVITNFNYYQMNHYQSNVYSSSSGIRPMIKFASTFVDDYENTFNQTDVRIDVRRSDSNSLFASGTKSVADGNEYTESTIAFCYKNKRNEEKTIDSDSGVFYIAHSEFPIRDIRIQGKVKTTTVTGTNGFSASLVYYSLSDSTPLYASAGEIKNIYIDKIEHTPLTKLNNISSSSLGTVFTLGEYPQRRVTDGYLIEQLDHCEHNWQSYGYYSGDGSYASCQRDYMQYADINYADHKYRAVKFSHYRPTFTYEDCTAEKTLQDDHGYEPDTVYYFSYDPLQWKVIDGASGRAICLNIIDAQAFNSNIFVVQDGETQIPVSGNAWQGSDLCSWLNQDFYNTAFSVADKQQIKMTKVTKNGLCDNYVVLPDNSDADIIRTSNKVFSNYKTEDPEPIVTDYAKVQGVENDSHPTEKDIFYRLINPIDGNKFNRGTGIATRIQTITNYVYYLNNLNISNTYSTASGVRPVISMKNYYFDEFGQKYSAEDMRIEFRDTDTKELLHPLNGCNKVEVKYKNKYYNNFASESANGVIHVNEEKTPLRITSVEFWTYEATDFNYEDDMCYTEYTTYDYKYVGTEDIAGNAGDVIVIYIKPEIEKYRDYHETFTETTAEEREQAAQSYHGKKFPAGYDWDLNKLRFNNPGGEIIEKKVYTDMFGDVQGTVLYDVEYVATLGKPGTGGLCTGMSTITSALLKKYITISDFCDRDFGNEIKHIKDIWGFYNFDKYPNINSDMTLMDAIKYGQVFLSSFEIQSQRNANKNKLDKLYSAIQRFISGGEPVIIIVHGALFKQGGHTVLGVGLLEEDSDHVKIILDDSNYNDGTKTKRELRYLTLTKKDGKFTDWEFEFESGNIYRSSSIGSSISFANTAAPFCYRMNNINDKIYFEQHNILRTDQENQFTNTIALEIETADSIATATDSIKDNSERLYWIDNETHDLELIAQGDSFYELSSSVSSVKVEAHDGNTIKLKSGSEVEDSIELSGNENEEITLSFLKKKSTEGLQRITISGNIAKKDVVLKEKNNDVSITGLNQLTITVSDDETDIVSDEISVEVVDGRDVTIIVDEKEATICTDFDNQAPEEQTSPEEDTTNLCKFCGKNHENTFWGRLISFFHKVAYFFAHLFGKM